MLPKVGSMMTEITIVYTDHMRWNQPGLARMLSAAKNLGVLRLNGQQTLSTMGPSAGIRSFRPVIVCELCELHCPRLRCLEIDYNYTFGESWLMRVLLRHARTLRALPLSIGRCQETVDGICEIIIPQLVTKLDLERITFQHVFYQLRPEILHTIEQWSPPLFGYQVVTQRLFSEIIWSKQFSVLDHIP